MHRSLASLALLVAATTPAFADSSASANISRIEFSLIDLNPNDGIAPSLTLDTSASSFLSQTESKITDLSVFVPGTSTGVQEDLSRSFVGGATSASAGHAPNLSSASVEGITMSGSVVHVGSVAVGGSAQGQNRFDADALLRNYAASLVLSPYTGLFVSAVGNVRADASGGGTANAAAWLSISGASNTGTQTGTERVEVSASSAAPASRNIQPFTLSFANGSGSSRAVLLDVGAQVSGVAAPVPEPESIALMMPGLGLIGALAWRRRRA